MQHKSSLVTQLPADGNISRGLIGTLSITEAVYAYFHVHDLGEQLTRLSDMTFSVPAQADRAQAPLIENIHELLRLPAPLQETNDATRK